MRCFRVPVCPRIVRCAAITFFLKDKVGLWTGELIILRCGHEADSRELRQEMSNTFPLNVFTARPRNVACIFRWCSHQIIRQTAAAWIRHKRCCARP